MAGHPKSIFPGVTKLGPTLLEVGPAPPFLLTLMEEDMREFVFGSDLQFQNLKAELEDNKCHVNWSTLLILHESKYQAPSL